MAKIILSEDRISIKTKHGLISVNPSTGDALCFDEYGDAEAISIEMAKSEFISAGEEMGKKLFEIKSALKKLERL